VASALRRGIQANFVRPNAGRHLLATALRLPIRLRSHGELAGPALDAALQHGLSTYDATYLVLAEALGATLVTADRVLAGAATRAELIP
jgi:predicted nucleic acid-binding protein